MLMPKISLESTGLNDSDLAPARGIIATRGKNKGRLRASRPPVTREDVGPDPDNPNYRLWKIEGGETAYIWRMVAFYVSPQQAHHSMPITCFFEFPLKASTPEGKALVRRLDIIVDAIVDTIHPSQWYGVHQYRGLV